MKNNMFNRISFFRTFPILGVLCFVIFGTVNLFSQTAMVTENFVYYPGYNEQEVDYQCIVPSTGYPNSTDYGNRSFFQNSDNWLLNGYNQSSHDPWVNSALIEYDNVFNDPAHGSKSTYPNHCLTLCAEVTCTNPVRKVENSNSGGTGTVISTMASGDFPIQSILFDIFKYQAGSNPYNPDTTPPIRTIAMYPSENSGIDNICKGVPIYEDDDCKEDPTSCESCCDHCTWSDANNCVATSGNQCISFGSEDECDNNSTFCEWSPACSYKAGTCELLTTLSACNGTTYCQPQYTGGSCQAINPQCGSIGDQTECESHTCCMWMSSSCGEEPNCGSDCNNYVSESNCELDEQCEWYGGMFSSCEYKPDSCTPTTCSSDYCVSSGSVCNEKSPSPCSNFQTQSACNSTFCTWATTPTSSCTGNCSIINDVFQTKEDCKAGITTLHFCTPWDGSYEIDGEFGKTNGQFGFRTTIKTNYPGDGITVTSGLNIEHMIAYPGDTQIPIQVDVTNVHSVRSSPTLAGKTPAVTTAPYKIKYRLSKDATTTIDIIDPEMSSSGNFKIHRHLVNGQPRDGEGFQGGAQSDIVVTNEENWDGRDDQGRLLPYGNYMVSIQASTRDEWTGATNQDLSRAVTRQLSLDPLKITDIAVTGLGKESTSYAKIDYLLTEAATVHFEIYTPGTIFEDLNICNVTNGSSCTNGYMTNANGVQGAPTVAKQNNKDTGLRVASYIEQKARRVLVNSKWDGMCWDTENCGSTQSAAGSTWKGYAYGGAMPDGDYVYLLWAEIPYGSTSGQGGGTFDPKDNTIEVNGVEWDGVKTHMIYNGIIPINRGFPEITIDAVSYSTIGSSPIANGLDPFVVSYSLSRDSYVDAGIYTIASSGTFTDGVCETGTTGSAVTTQCAPYKVKTISENEVKESLTKNVYYWDGLDDNGRYVSAGNYMLRITAKDSLFPTKMVTRTIEFPVDMFRLVDVTTTPLLELGSSNTLSGVASINYMLSKSMDVSVKVYEQGVVIPTGGNCSWPPVEGLGYCNIHSSTDTTYVPKAIKEFKGTRQGEGYTITDYWDGYKIDPLTSESEMMPDGLYPYIIVASASLPGAQYYSTDTAIVYPLYGPFHPLNAIYANDRVSGYITVSRGPVYFTDINIRPTHPKQYYSSATVELAPYEVQFTVNRVSSVTVEIISTVNGACSGSASPAGSTCRTLTKTNFGGGAFQYNVYDAGIQNTLYWDGKDEHGQYVKTANYKVKFTAAPYLNNNSSDPGLNVTVENRNLVVNNFQVFDRYIWDVSAQNKNQGKFAYQISIPMKTAIQIFKPNTKVGNLISGDLKNPIQGSGVVYSTDTRDVLVKAIVGVRPNLVSLEEIWDGTDYAGQRVPDGVYPYRFVTVLDNYQMNSVTGDPIISYSTQPVSEIVMDWDKYINFSEINVVNGDSWYADVDWKDPKVTMFYPNPLKEKSGFFEVTKVPAPGTLTIKIYNIAGDLVRDSGYDCVNAIGTTATLEDINSVYGGLTPDWNSGGYSNPSTTGLPDPSLLGSNAIGRNFALRCEWDKTNNAGNKVARGLYYAIMTLKPTRGNAKNSQRVIKILIP